MKDLAAIETLPLGTYWPVFIRGKKKKNKKKGGRNKGKKTFQLNERREKTQNLSHSSSEATGKTSTEHPKSIIFPKR